MSSLVLSASSVASVPDDPLAAFVVLCQQSIEAWEATGAPGRLVAETRDPAAAGALVWFETPQRLLEVLAELLAGARVDAERAGILGTFCGANGGLDEDLQREAVQSLRRARLRSRRAMPPRLACVVAVRHGQRTRAHFVIVGD